MGRLAPPGALALVAALALALAAAVGLAGTATAHSLLLSSDPPAGISLETAPRIVILTFGEPPDPALSRVRVLDAAGVDHASGPPVAAEGDPSTLRVPVGALDDGVHTVAWRVVSSVDGHASAGSFAFGVGDAEVASPAPSVPGSGEAAGSGAGVLARWFLYLGLSGVLGAAFVASVVHPRPPRRLVRLAAGSWLLAAAGTVAVLVVQWLDSGVDPGGLLGSSLGPAVVARGAVVAATGLLVALLARQAADRSSRLIHALVLAGAAAALLVDVAAGHAAASRLPAVAIAVQWVHALGAAAWIGGLAALLVALAGLPSEEKTAAVRRYSRWAGILLAAVALTGIARAIDQVGSPEALLGSDFGRLVLAKSVGLLVLGALGAFNRFVNVRAVARALTGLRRVGSGEVAVGALVLLLSAFLVNAVPPAALAPSEPEAEPLVATGHDFGTSVRVRLEIDPGSAGFNRFAASVTDYDTGALAPVSGVSLGFALTSRTGVGPSSLELSPVGESRFEASGGTLSIDGIWRVTALVAGPGGSLEVPFVVATRIARQAVMTDASITPVLYTIALPDGASAQVYLDPGHPGPNDLHVTFFDTSGTALDVTDVVVAVGRAESAGEALVARALAPGHLVGSLTEATAGPLRVDVLGRHPDGSQIHVSVEIEVTP